MKPDGMITLPPIDRELAKTRPYCARYIQLHGRSACISEKYNTANLAGYKNTEEIYRECLDRGVTWEKLIGRNPALENAVL